MGGAFRDEFAVFSLVLSVEAGEVSLTGHKGISPSSILILCGAAGFFNIAPPGQAPALVATGNDYTSTPSGAPALILRTDVQFRLTTASGFTPDAQLTFSNALRQVLAAYNFMSISITAFQVRHGVKHLNPTSVPQGQQVKRNVACAGL